MILGGPEVFVGWDWGDWEELGGDWEALGRTEGYWEVLGGPEVFVGWDW